MQDQPRTVWAVLMVQDSDGKVSVMEIPFGNNIEVNTRIDQEHVPDLVIDGMPHRLGCDVPGQRLKVTIEASIGKSAVPLVVLRGHG